MLRKKKMESSSTARADNIHNSCWLVLCAPHSYATQTNTCRSMNKWQNLCWSSTDSHWSAFWDVIWHISERVDMSMHVWKYFCAFCILFSLLTAVIPGILPVRWILHAARKPGKCINYNKLLPGLWASCTWLSLCFPHLEGCGLYVLR